MGSISILTTKIQPPETTRESQSKSTGQTILSSILPFRIPIILTCSEFSAVTTLSEVAHCTENRILSTTLLAQAITPIVFRHSPEVAIPVSQTDFLIASS